MPCMRFFFKPACGVAHFALPCGSWLWAKRATSQRTPTNPLGNTARQYIARAIWMVSRLALLLKAGAPA
eukprot:203809-Prorocentrum_lima.AAC.1